MFEKLEEKMLQKRLKKRADYLRDSIKRCKVYLYDIEHDDFPKNEVLRNGVIRVMLVGTGCTNLEELYEYYKEQIAMYKKEMNATYIKLACYSKWQPPKIEEG